MNYQSPVLSEVGDVNDVVLGVVSLGNDLDGHCIVFEQEWADDDFSL